MKSRTCADAAVADVPQAAAGAAAERHARGKEWNAWWADTLAGDLLTYVRTIAREAFFAGWEAAAPLIVMADDPQETVTTAGLTAPEWEAWETSVRRGLAVTAADVRAMTAAAAPFIAARAAAAERERIRQLA